MAFAVGGTYHSRVELRIRLSALSLAVATVLAATAFQANISRAASTISPDTWGVFKSPNPPAGHSDLSGVACPLVNDCWAVGEVAHEILMERYDGSTWIVYPQPQFSAARLNAVSCTVPGDCWAVGSVDSSPLAMHFDGRAWTIVAVPAPPATASWFLGVTCLDGRDCWAVGVMNTPSFQAPLTEHFDGVSWSLGRDSALSALHGFLYGVACISTINCWAVGANNALAAHYDGTTWAIASVPSPGANALLNAITCDGGGQCWAVGAFYSAGLLTLTERFDGTGWSVVPSPNISSDDELFGVTCVSRSDCWAVGQAGGSTLTTTVERFDGNSWLLGQVPYWPSPFTTLESVACIAARDCWAVGMLSDSLGTAAVDHHADATSVGVTCSPNPVPVGTLTTCTAVVADLDYPAVIVTGDVRWGDRFGAFSAKRCRLVAGRCSVTFVPSTGQNSVMIANFEGTNYQLGSQGRTLV